MLPISVEMVPLMCTLLSVPVLEYGTLTLLHWSVLNLILIQVCHLEVLDYQPFLGWLLLFFSWWYSALLQLL
jgi:hypothetical protein